MEIKSNLNRISKYFKLPSMHLAEMAKQYETEDKLHENKYPTHTDNYIFGIEVEVEGVPEPHVNALHRSFWNITGDGSLRNAGVEFVSVPLRMSQIEKALTQLNKSLPTTASFSERTSVHVHMNVRDLNIHQISSLVLLYTAVENILFNWIGHDRDTNVFCTKLIETNYAKHFNEINDDLGTAVGNWNKYTALNLVPIHDKGTVEFRQMYGTTDIPTLMKWVNMLACLKTAAKKHETQVIFNTICELNSSSLYEEFIRSIFGEYAEYLLRNANTKEMMEEAISYIKLMQAYYQPEQTDMPTETPRHRPVLGEIDWEVAEQRFTANQRAAQTGTIQVNGDIMDYQARTGFVPPVPPATPTPAPVRAMTLEQAAAYHRANLAREEARAREERVMREYINQIRNA